MDVWSWKDIRIEREIIREPGRGTNQLTDDLLVVSLTDNITV